MGRRGLIDGEPLASRGRGVNNHHVLRGPEGPRIGASFDSKPTVLVGPLRDPAVAAYAGDVRVRVRDRATVPLAATIAHAY